MAALLRQCLDLGVLRVLPYKRVLSTLQGVRVTPIV